MTTSPQAMGQTFINPLEGPAGIIVFLVLVFSQVSIAFIVCSGFLPMGLPLKQLTLQLFIIVVAIGWYSFTISSDEQDFIKLGLWLTCLCYSPNSMILNNDIYTFWISLLMINIIAIQSVVEKKLTFWDNFVISIYVIWVITGFVITLGNTDYLPYSKQAAAIREIHYLLDMRVIITAFLFILFAIKAIWGAIQRGRPDIPSVPALTLPDIPSQQTSIFATIFRPFVMVINGILSVLQTILDILWKLAALVATYLGRFGANLANQFFDLIIDGRIWSSMLRILITFFFIVGFTYGVIKISPYISLYLTSSTSYSSLSWDDPISIALKWMIAFFLLSLLGILIISWLWHVKDFLVQTVFSGSIILVACALTGGIMYGAARINYLRITGFDSLGGFSFLMLMIVGSVFVVQVIRRIVS